MVREGVEEAFGPKLHIGEIAAENGSPPKVGLIGLAAWLEGVLYTSGSWVRFSFLDWRGLAGDKGERRGRAALDAFTRLHPGPEEPSSKGRLNEDLLKAEQVL